MRRTVHLVYPSPKTIETETNVKDKSQNYFPLSTTRRILSLIGALPCTGKSPYWPSLDRNKSNVVYNSVVLSVFTANILWTLITMKMEYDKIEPTQSLRRVVLFDTAIIMVPFLNVFLVWRDASEYYQFMKIIDDFQVKFQQITGRLFEMHTPIIEKGLSLSALVGIPSFYYLCCYFIPDLDSSPAVALAVAYGNMVSFYVVLSWIFVTVSIGDALEDIQNELKQLLRRENLAPNIVFEIRLLWVSLREACDSMSRWRAPAVGYTSCLLLSIVLVYQTLTFLQEKNFNVALGLVTTSCIYIGVIAFVCRASHETQEKMKVLVKDTLSSISLSSYSGGTQREILMLYLVESARPVVTTVDGLLTVNRHLLLSFLSGVVTYIIVLVQFFPR